MAVRMKLADDGDVLATRKFNDGTNIDPHTNISL